MLSFLLLCFLISIQHAYYEVQGPFRHFLDQNQNNAKDYLVDGIQWYQFKIQLYGMYHHIPLSIASQSKYNNATDRCIYIWTLSLPIGNVVTQRNLQRQKNGHLISSYGTPTDVQRAVNKSCMTITMENDKYTATIDAVHANKYYSGPEIMTIFMMIAVKQNIVFEHVLLTDTAKKYCSMQISNLVFAHDYVPHSVFMAFLGRLDFFREYGFYVAERTAAGYVADEEKQAEYDAASKKLYTLKMTDVIRAAGHAYVGQKPFVKRLVNYLKNEKHPEDVTMSDYLQPFSWYDNWGIECWKYMQAVAGLESIPRIRRQYFDGMKQGKVQLIWKESELEALDARLYVVMN